MVQNYYNTKIIDSLISGSNQGLQFSGDLTMMLINSVIFTTSQSYELEKNVPYTLQFDVLIFIKIFQDKDGDTKQHLM